MSVTQRPVVLVIDHDSATQQTISDLLQAFHLDTIMVSTATEGAQILRSGVMPSFILLSLDLPDIDGIDFTLQMRAHSQFDRVSVVVMIEDIDPQRIRDAFQAGADRYITKQYLHHNLPRVIQAILSFGRRKASTSHPQTY